MVIIQSKLDLLLQSEILTSQESEIIEATPQSALVQPQPKRQVVVGVWQLSSKFVIAIIAVFKRVLITLFNQLH